MADLEFTTLAGRAGEQARRMQKVLLDMGVKPSHVKVAIERAEMTGETLPAIMRDFGFMGPEEVAEAVSLQFGMEYFAPTRLAELDPADMQRTLMPTFRPLCACWLRPRRQAQGAGRRRKRYQRRQ